LAGQGRELPDPALLTSTTWVFFAFLTPPVLAKDTLRLVNADYLAAPGTDPLFFFASDEMPYAELPDALQIVDHAHAVLGSIALVQMVQRGAREAATIEAVLHLAIHYFLTVLDTACNAGSRFEAVVTPAAGACLHVSHVSATKATVHSAGCDQRRMNRPCPC
jgi:hypothetical protein